MSDLLTMLKISCTVYAVAKSAGKHEDAEELLQKIEKRVEELSDEEYKELMHFIKKEM